jgi:xanthine dehydrogenase iron-sulfur cluster and FAD-binding subunit A
MFKSFFHKKKKLEKVELAETLSQQEKNSLYQQVNNLKSRLQSVQGDRRIVILNDLAESYRKLHEVDQAIYYFEASLQEKEQFGAAYNGLLKLYEVKRKEAAINKNDADIQKWVAKMEYLLAVSKRVMRSNM